MEEGVKPPKNKIVLLIAFSCIVILLFAGVVFWVTQKNNPLSQKQEQKNDTSVTQGQNVSEGTEGMETLTYKDGFFDFSLKYPKDWRKPTVPLADPNPNLSWHKTGFALEAQSTGMFVGLYNMEKILVDVETLPSGVTTLEQYVQFIDKKNAESSSATQVLETKKLTINGVEAIQRKERTKSLSEATGEGLQFLRTYVKGSSFVLVMRNKPTANLSTGAVSQAAQDIHNQILNTVIVK